MDHSSERCDLNGVIDALKSDIWGLTCFVANFIASLVVSFFLMSSCESSDQCVLL